MANTIIVVDGNERTRGSIVQALGPLRRRVVEASSGSQVLQMLQREDPGLFVIDVDMRGMNGWKLVTELRKHGEIQDVPMVALTTKKDLWHQKVMPTLWRVQACFPKPVNADDLCGTAQRLLGKG